MFAAEMGLGKSLAAIEVMEHSNYENWIWVGPRSVLAAVRLEFRKWECPMEPRFMTYDRLRKEVAAKTIDIPDGIIYDESSKCKTPEAQRSQAAAILAETMGFENPECFVILMSGSPAPKSPLDWWHQCEIACPGFLREGSRKSFQKRLALVENKESITGGVYPELITWWDDETKCGTCGFPRADHEVNGDPLSELTGEADYIDDHKWCRSTDEVQELYERMEGLVIVQFKKDCLDLPDRVFRTIRLDVDPSTLRVASLITANSARAIQALTLMRELSDGFQYTEEQDGTQDCPRCFGTCEIKEWFDPERPDEAVSPEAVESGRCQERESVCPSCKEGQVPRMVRTAVEVPTPKEQLLIDLLDEYESVGRFVVYAGFQASVDRCIKIAQRYQWDVIAVDGRGWRYMTDDPEKCRIAPEDMLEIFQSAEGNKTVFIGQPGAAGMGLTLTASPATFFFSNSFNAEDRIQAMDRIHRIGMDTQRGATIIDAVHLPIDEYVLDNLSKKRDLQALTMGALKEAIDAANAEYQTREISNV